MANDCCDSVNTSYQMPDHVLNDIGYVIVENQYTDACLTNLFKENGWQIDITKGGHWSVMSLSWVH